MVIGNPPYVRAENIEKFNGIISYLKTQNTLEHLDDLISILFSMNWLLQILKPNGFLSFIFLPHFLIKTILHYKKLVS
ncbi:MAG: hypothetical protein IPK62_15640 [Bacteroidetes bacterium]|nr:hypothetical protein [Bacteroidota bacterium]